METAAPPLGLKVEDEDGFDIGRRLPLERTLNCLGSRIAGGYYCLCRRIFVAGNVETDNIFVVRTAICERCRAAPEDRSEAIISSSKQALQIFLGLGGLLVEGLAVRG